MKTKTSIKALLFDLDGTLLDTAPDFITVVNQMLKHHGKTALTDDIIRNTVSNGARALVTLAFQLQTHDEKFNQFYQELLTLYAQQLGTLTQAFAGIEECLTLIEQHKLKWGIVTNKPRSYTLPLLDAMHLSQRCHVVICPDDVQNTKPDPEGLLKACQIIGVSQQESVYIGDHQRDIEAGRNAGMLTIAAMYGYIDKSENPQDWQADFYVHSAHDITIWLNQQLGH